MGVRSHRRSGVPLQLECVSHPARSLWHARRAAVRTRGVQGAARTAYHNGTNAPLELARGRRWLLPAAALQRVAVVDTARRRGRRAPRAVLLPPVGARPGPAARQGSGSESAIPPLSQPRAHAAANAPSADRLQLGSRRPCVSGGPTLMNDDAMHADPQLQKYISARIGARVPALAIIVALLLAWIFAVYWPTTYSMVSIWERSETFAHGFVVIPIFLYLLWRQRETLAAIEPRPFLPALLGIVGAGAVWFIGDRLSIISLTQFAMMGIVPFAVWAVLGTETLRALLFPLAFLFFAVPFGDFLVPPLMNRTAVFAAIAFRASGG